MKTIKQTTKETVVTIGNFDGLHKGHLKLIQKTKQIAEKNNLKSLICSFNCNTKGAQTIFCGSELREGLTSLKIDYFCNLNFLQEIKHLDCEAFAKSFLKERFSAKYVVVGENFRFGKNRSGDTETLKELGKACGFSVVVVTMSNAYKNQLSSTLIRQWLSEGKLTLANRVMLFPYSLSGTVKKGYSAGHSLLNVPTANFSMHKNGVALPFGVYVTTTEIDGKIYPSITNIGYAPTLPKTRPTVETYIFDFSEDIYGKRMKIRFYQYIRKERKFSSMNALKKQIETDVAKCKRYFEKKDFNL